MSYRPIFFTTGVLLIILAVSMLIPTVVDIYSGNTEWRVFAGAQFVTGVFGLALALTTYQKEFTLNTKQAFLLTNISWIAISFFGALPFFFSDVGLSFTDALFESTSGITTTGATILSDIEQFPEGILLWRAILQWLGGVGIMVMAMSILPILHVGGMQIFKSESFEIEKVLPSASKIATYIGIIYIVFTLICTVLYAAAGMNTFDAFAHGMTTLATGGYSTYNDSIGHFDSAAIDYICIFFMWVGALPFVLYLHLLNGQSKVILKDTQVKCFTLILVFISAAVALYLIQNNGFAFGDAIRYALFNITAVMTGTGYATADYALWGSFVVGVAFFASWIGGCAGSTTGGVKVFRLQVLYTIAKAETKRMMSPHGIFPAYYNNRQIPREVPIAVMSFFFIFFMSFVVLGVLLQLCGLDFVTAFSGAISALANVGPGLGDIIGPAGNYSSLPDTAKWLLCGGMLLGRLEIFTFLVMVLPRFWRH